MADTRERMEPAEGQLWIHAYGHADGKPFMIKPASRPGWWSCGCGRCGDSPAWEMGFRTGELVFVGWAPGYGPQPPAAQPVADHGVRVGDRFEVTTDGWSAPRGTVVTVRELVLGSDRFWFTWGGRTEAWAGREHIEDGKIKRIADAPAEKAGTVDIGVPQCPAPPKPTPPGMPTQPPKPQRRYVSSNGRDWAEYDRLIDADPFETYPWRRVGETGVAHMDPRLIDARMLAQITLGADKLARAAMDARDMFRPSAPAPQSYVRQVDDYDLLPDA